MMNSTSYTDKLPNKLNNMLKSFTGSECIMVRKQKHKISKNNLQGQCHVNVQNFVTKDGGISVSGWLLNRIPSLITMGIYVWSFHSVWQSPDNKLIDVTEDENYIGRDKSIFIPDLNRTPDLKNGTSYNNFMTFTDCSIAGYYGSSIGKDIEVNEPYWCNNTMTMLLDVNEHSGTYRYLNAIYPDNLKKFKDELECEIVNGRPIPRPGSKYEEIGAFPATVFFDYSLSCK